MSGGPVGVENEIDMVAKYHCFINLNLSPESWCKYEGGPEACGLDNLVTDRDIVCLYCTYRQKLFIPDMIKAHMQRRKGVKCKL